MKNHVFEYLLTARIQVVAQNEVQAYDKLKDWLDRWDTPTDIIGAMHPRWVTRLVYEEIAGKSTLNGLNAEKKKKKKNRRRGNGQSAATVK